MRLEDIEVIDDLGIDENKELTEKMQENNINDSEIDNLKIYKEIIEHIPESAKRLSKTAEALKVLSVLCIFFSIFIAVAKMWIPMVSILGTGIILLITGFLFDAISDITTNTARTNDLIALQTKMML